MSDMQINPAIRIKIALSVDHEGNWSAAGWKGATDEVMRSSTIDCLESGEQHYWLITYIDKPSVPEIKVAADPVKQDMPSPNKIALDTAKESEGEP